MHVTSAAGTDLRVSQFVLPMRGCTIRLDDTVVVDAGQVVSAALT